MSCNSIDQFHPSVREHDAISNEMLALQDIFRGLGFQSRLYSSEPGRLYGKKVECLDDYSAERGEDHMLVHYSLGSDLFDEVFALPVRRSLIYHNITPPELMSCMDSSRQMAARRGREELCHFASMASRIVAHSRFSATDLEKCAVRSFEVIPYTFYEPLYDFEPDGEVLRRFGDGTRNLLFVGRVVPHKRLEDCLFILDYLKRNTGQKWRLIVAGSWNEAELYQQRLVEIAENMALQDVCYLGDVTQPALIACYHAATAFLHMSDYEGFGVPLVEAMRFGVPVFAYTAGAVPEVLGDAGMPFGERDHALVAETIALVTSNPFERERIVKRQLERCQNYTEDAARNRWREWLEKAISAT